MCLNYESRLKLVRTNVHMSARTGTTKTTLKH